MSKKSLVKVKGTELPESSRTDLERLDAMRDEDIDLSDSPQLTAKWAKSAKLVIPGAKKVVSIRLEEDLIGWYKDRSGGSGYQKLIRQVLHAYRKHAEQA